MNVLRVGFNIMKASKSIEQTCIFDICAADYEPLRDGNEWLARIGSPAIVHGSVKHDPKDNAVRMPYVSSYVKVQLNILPYIMPELTIDIWAKFESFPPARCKGWLLAQFPDRGSARAITLNDPSLNENQGPHEAP